VQPHSNTEARLIRRALQFQRWALQFQRERPAAQHMPHALSRRMLAPGPQEHAQLPSVHQPKRTPRRARPRAGRRHCGRSCCARTPSSPQVRGRAERLQPRRILPPKPQKLPAAPAAPARAGHSLSTLDAWTSGLFFASRCRSIFL
jgi:hypothetical protein